MNSLLNDWKSGKMGWVRGCAPIKIQTEKNSSSIWTLYTAIHCNRKQAPYVSKLKMHERLHTAAPVLLQ